MLRFTIRDVLWLTVVAALGVVWVLERQRSKRLDRHVSVVESELANARVAMKRFYEDLDRIEQALPAHGLAIMWSKDMRPSLQATPPAAGGPPTLTRP